MKYIFLILTLLIVSCKKVEIKTPYIFSEASYKMTLTMNWASPQFSVPAGAHVTAIIGMVNSKDTFLWKENILATPGLEDVAEVGNTVKMNAELDVIISKFKALSKFEIPAPLITGSIEPTIKVNSAFPAISFASMIAPSPDWFMGINNATLFVNNKWVDELILNVRVYDAGTEEGDVFDYNNPSTIPQQPIKLLTPANATVLANNNFSIAPIATVRFVKN